MKWNERYIGRKVKSQAGSLLRGRKKGEIKGRKKGGKKGRRQAKY